MKIVNFLSFYIYRKEFSFHFHFLKKISIIEINKKQETAYKWKKQEKIKKPAN